MRRVALFATCLAEAFAPEVAQAAADVVAAADPDATVEIVGEACCGQPAWNAGYPREARALARRLIPRLLPYDSVIVPSGSCATMLLRYYLHLFEADDPLAAQAAALAQRTFEFSAHIAKDLPPTEERAGSHDRVAFHPSCHSLRGAFVGDSGERCLAASGCRLCHQRDADECCGFGGLFAVKEPALSVAMADRKLDAFIAAGAGTVVSGEMGCLLHLEGRARRRGMHLTFRHLALVLAERSKKGDQADD